MKEVCYFCRGYSVQVALLEVNLCSLCSCLCGICPNFSYSCSIGVRQHSLCCINCRYILDYAARWKLPELAFNNEDRMCLMSTQWKLQKGLFFLTAVCKNIKETEFHETKDKSIRLLILCKKDYSATFW